MNSNAVDVPTLPAMKPYNPSIGEIGGEVCAALISIWSIRPFVRVERERSNHSWAHDYRRAVEPSYMSQHL